MKFTTSLLLFVAVIGIGIADDEKEADPNYIVMSPSEVRPGSKYDLSVFILKPNVQVQVTATMYSSEMTVATMSKSFTQANPGTLQLTIPMELTESSYNLKVELSGLGEERLIEEKEVEVKAKSMSIFIQTDKAIYKPGDTVKFRVFAVFPTMTPYQHPLTITISDPKDNKIEQWVDQETNNGVFDDSIELSTEPRMGEWKISVESFDQETVKMFEVDEYVLPKFEVSVGAPSFYAINTRVKQQEALALQKDIQFTVAAKYTYGQAVKGKAEVYVQIAPYGTYDKGRYLKKKYEMDVGPSNNGMLDLSISYADLIHLVPPPSYNNPSWEAHTHGLTGRKILIMANVTETATGITLSGNTSFPVTNEKYKLEFLEITPTNYKPGLIYYGYLQLTQSDGTPPEAKDIHDQTCTIEGTFYYAYSSPYRQPVKFRDSQMIPESGLMQFNATIEDSFDSLTFNVRCMDRLNAYKSNIRQFKSYSDEGLQITIRDSEGTIKPGDNVAFDVLSTEPIRGFNYVLLSKGAIAYSSYHDSGSEATEHIVTIPVSSELAHTLAPAARMTIFYTTESGEIVSDSLELTVDGAFLNQVSLEFQHEERKPGETNTLKVQAKPQSFVGLLAVDKSVQLLKSGNDVTQDDVLDELKEYDTSEINGGYYPFMRGMIDRKKRSIWWPISSGGSTTAEIFEKAGVIVFTDALIYEAEDDSGRGDLVAFDNPGRPQFRGEAQPVEKFSPGTNPEVEMFESNPASKPSKVRSKFPESWIWDFVFTDGESGQTSLDVVVPDTITSWVATAFAMNDEYGLGITDTAAMMTTFTPFFVSLTLPYSVIRGEEFALKATVFNYRSTKEDVTVTLPESTTRAFGVRESENDIESSFKSLVRKISVDANDAVTVEFWIVPKQLGHIPIKVMAQSASAADAVERKLLVEAEGVEQMYTQSLFISLSEDDSSFSGSVQISLPTDELVPDSTHLEVTAVGDVMGSTINGLESLIRMPYGCGEQNMLNFAPNIYVLQYLEETNQDSASIKTTAKDYMKKGYQRELNYQRKDGSFSAFGDSDDEGSTWLTAFVIRCFHQAKDYITIDMKDVQKAINWVIDHQYRDGQFEEPGRVIHSNMQGGASKGIAMTAYTLTSLLENNDDTLDETTSRRLTGAIRKTVEYLESKISDPLVQSDIYAMSVIAYALKLADSPKADEALEILEAAATTDDGMHLVVDSSSDDAISTRMGWVPPYHQAGASNIEATAYLLQNYVEREDIPNALLVAKWIIRQRNAFGGFSSTQDTVVALQALAGFAALTSGAENEGLEIEIELGRFVHNFDVLTKSNAIIMQAVEPPMEGSDTVYVTASGRGTGIVQVNVKYNVYSLASKADMDVTVKSTGKDDGSVDVEICNKWTAEKESGMVVSEVHMLSGYQPVEPKELINSIDTLKRVETNEQKVIFYFDEATIAQKCLTLKTKASEKVTNLQPAVVRSYPYYDLNKAVVTSYMVPEALTSTGGGTSAAASFFTREPMLLTLLAVAICTAA